MKMQVPSIIAMKQARGSEQQVVVSGLTYDPQVPHYLRPLKWPATVRAPGTWEDASCVVDLGFQECVVLLAGNSLASR